MKKTLAAAAIAAAPLAAVMSTAPAQAVELPVHTDSVGVGTLPVDQLTDGIGTVDTNAVNQVGGGLLGGLPV